MISKMELCQVDFRLAGASTARRCGDIGVRAVYRAIAGLR